MESNPAIILKIDHATDLFECFGVAVLSDPGLRILLDEYRRGIARTQQVMRAARLPLHCARCASTVQGSCCGEGIEEWYDEILLLINLLMGRSINMKRLFPGQCLFVGSSGCRLLARYSYCVNYFCPSLLDLLEKSQIGALRSAAGAELATGWELEVELRKWLGTKQREETDFSGISRIAANREITG